MTILQELMQLTEAKKKKVSKKMARRVYHRDYEKTKNKPYRKYDPKKSEHRALSEMEHPMMTADEMSKLSTFMTRSARDDKARQLRFDLHLLRMISHETQPNETEVATENGQKVVRFFYPLRKSPSEIFAKYKEMFGPPINRSHDVNEVMARFKDKLTGSVVTLRYSPTSKYFVAEYPLHATGVSEGTINHKDVFLMLVETPGIGAPYGGAAGADRNNGTADLRKDVSGMTDQVLFLRGALGKHLKADHHDWTYFENAASVEDAANRLVQIMRKLPEAVGASPDAVRETAEQVARVYWGQ